MDNTIKSMNIQRIRDSKGKINEYKTTLCDLNYFYIE